MWQPFFKISSPIKNRTTVVAVNIPATGQKEAVAMRGRKAIIVEEKGVSKTELRPIC